MTYRSQIVGPKVLARMNAVSSTILKPRGGAGTIEPRERVRWREPLPQDPRTGRASVSVIIPVHNEASRVSAVLRAVLDSHTVDRVIVVNDGSTDRTADIVREFEPEVTLIDLAQNRGKGGAMLAGPMPPMARRSCSSSTAICKTSHRSMWRPLCVLL